MTNSLLKCAAVLTAALFLNACSESTPTFHAEGSPQRLSDWGLFELGSQFLTVGASSEIFRPANQLFTDYAHKMRTLYIPEGSEAKLVDNEIVYPVGSIIAKTFYYPSDENGKLIKTADVNPDSIELGKHQLIETRLLVHRESGWDAFPYVWNDEQTEAFLRVAGASKPIKLGTDGEDIDFVYFVPNGNQCSGCHVTEHPDGGMHPLGALAAQLHSKRLPSDDQLQTESLVAKGWLDQAPDFAIEDSWRDESLPTEERALSYLNMHCGHCHNPEGAADTSGLLLDGSHESVVSMGVCKPPIAAGGGAGDLLYGIVPGKSDESILVYRMASEKPDEMMPELGRSLVHAEGIQLITSWIDAMEGSCN